MKARRHRPHANHERWLVSYADFITLLFAFFVVMYSTAQVDQRRVGKLAKAIEAGFQQMGVFDSSASKPPILIGQPISAAPSPTLEESEPADKPDMDIVQKKLESALSDQLASGFVAVTPTKEGIVVSLREAGFFDSGSTRLRPQALPTLAEFVSVIGTERMKVRIEGHTDNIPIHNHKFDSNWELSTARATEIIKLFITRFGIDPVRLSASGYGEYYPVSPNDSEADRAKNRRVDLVILNANATLHEPVANAEKRSSNPSAANASEGRRPQ
jgi:chemotaxis protein MotB